jgi:hypothetical protein
MAVLVGEVPGSRSFDESIDTTGKLTVTRGTTVLMLSNGQEGERDVLQSVGLVWGQPFGWGNVYDPQCKFRGASVEEHEEGTDFWKVALKYDNETKDAEDQEQETAPEARAPKVNWGFETQDVVIVYDQETQEPIANSSGEPLLVTTPAPIPILTITRYEATFSPLLIVDYVNRVNQSTFWGAPPKSVLLAGITASQEEIEGRTLWNVSYTFKFKVGNAFNDAGWQIQPLDNGTRYTESNQTKIFMDASGNPTSGYLDGSGGRSDVPYYLTFNLYAQKDFADLTLDYS